MVWFPTKWSKIIMLRQRISIKLNLTMKKYICLKQKNKTFQWSIQEKCRRFQSTRASARVPNWRNPLCRQVLSRCLDLSLKPQKASSLNTSHKAKIKTIYIIRCKSLPIQPVKALRGPVKQRFTSILTIWLTSVAIRGPEEPKRNRFLRKNSNLWA